MIKALNMLNYTSRFAALGAAATGSSPHERRVPRLVLGFAGAALAAVTIAISVILPARLDAVADDPRLHSASKAIADASSGAGAVMSITVVAAREPRSSTSSLRMIETAPSPDVSSETASSPILRISTAAR